jgi:hypothetical protein
MRSPPPMPPAERKGVMALALEMLSRIRLLGSLILAQFSRSSKVLMRLGSEAKFDSFRYIFNKDLSLT